MGIGMTDKKELLSQLQIDRSAKTESSGSSKMVAAIAIIAVLAIGGASWTYLSGSENNDTLAVAENSSDNSREIADKSAGGTDITAAEPIDVDKPAQVAAVQSDGDTILDASGYITARRMATVSAELTGRITDVLVEEGMRVEPGQVLARLDDAVAQVNLQLAQAQVTVTEARIESAVAQLKEAETVLARVSSLQTNDFSSEARLTNSEFQVASSKAELARARADAEVARLEVARQQERLDDHTVRAPFGGVVTIKNAQPGEIVAPGSAGGGFTRTGICTIVDMSSLEIEVDVNEAFIGRVFDGQRVKANLDAYPEWDIPARVIAIIPTANREKATVRVRVGIESDDNRILPDMGVKVSFYRN